MNFCGTNTAVAQPTLCTQSGCDLEVKEGHKLVVRLRKSLHRRVPLRSFRLMSRPGSVQFRGAIKLARDQ